jgi:aminoglycoside 6'-N-acetyltransferase I
MESKQIKDRSNVTTRPIRASDDEAVAWADFRQRLWPDADAAELLEEARSFLSGAGVPTISCVFLAAEEETAKLLGFIELSVRPFSDGCESRPVPHVEGWYVEPLARRRGIGRALMERAEAWASAQGFGELASDTEVDNGASLAAHARCGFVETERLIKLKKTLA